MDKSSMRSKAIDVNKRQNMSKELLHEYGLNEQGQLLKAKNALKGDKYICPGCNTDFILKKSGNTGAGSRRPHFAHNNFEGSCSYESYLHKTFILRAVEYLANCISNNLLIEFHWICNNCKQPHSCKLDGFSGVKAEFGLKERRPDIALFDHAGQVVIVIEIIYKHPPEDEAIQFYHQQNINVMQIHIASHEDLDNVKAKLEIPKNFDLCIAKRVPSPVYQKPSTRSGNVVPRDFLDKPKKYFQAKNGNIYHKKGSRV